MTASAENILHMPDYLKEYKQMASCPNVKHCILVRNVVLNLGTFMLKWVAEPYAYATETMMSG